jgi:hypothetical protein
MSQPGAYPSISASRDGDSNFNMLLNSFRILERLLIWYDRGRKRLDG